MSSGQKFMLLNGGPVFNPNPSISFFTVLVSEAEINEVWERLVQNGKTLMPLDSYPWASRYGWIEDQYGISWQLTLDKPERISERFYPSFLFTGSQYSRAETAINFYLSIFEHTSLRVISRYGADQPTQEGKINHSKFLLNGQLFIAIDNNFDHNFTFTEGVSLVVECENQDEIDFYWKKLTEGGVESQCGWLKDQFGVSWQIVPAILNKLMSDPDRSQRVMQAFLKMKKLDIDTLLKA